MTTGSFFSNFDDKLTETRCSETRPFEYEQCGITDWTSCVPSIQVISIEEIERVKENLISNINEDSCSLKTYSKKYKSAERNSIEKIKRKLEKYFLNSAKIKEIGFPLTFSSRKVLEFMYASWFNQRVCDLILVTKDGEVLTHQLLIAFYSPIFEKNFISHNCKRLTLKVKECSRETVLAIIRFLYIREIELNCNTLLEVLVFANKIHLDILKQLCEDYLVSTIDWNNSILYLSISINNNLPGATTECLKYLHEMQPSLLLHPHFPLILYKHLDALTTHLKNTICSSILLEIILEWVKYSPTTRTKHIKELFKKVDFNCISEYHICPIFENFKRLLQKIDFEGNPPSSLDSFIINNCSPKRKRSLC